MTASMFEQHTVLPPADPQERARLAAMLDELDAALADAAMPGAGRPSLPQQSERAATAEEARPVLLLAPDGHRVEIPGELFEVLLQLARAMADDRAITVAPHSLSMTTQQAAGFLGISRPTLVKLLERGEIPYTKPNRHRRVRLPDLLAYQQRRDSERRAALRELTRDAEEIGFYDVPAPPAPVAD